MPDYKVTFKRSVRVKKVSDDSEAELKAMDNLIAAWNSPKAVNEIFNIKVEED